MFAFPTPPHLSRRPEMSTASPPLVAAAGWPAAAARRYRPAERVMAALLCCPPRRQRGSARCSLAAAARSIQRIPGDPPGLPLRGPDPGFDAREAVTSSNVWAADRWPDLAPFLESGRIVCVRRPEGGLRGEDEPECAVIVCADHASLSLDGGAPSADRNKLIHICVLVGCFGQR